MRQRYGLKSYVAAGCRFALRLEFVENRLVQVRLHQHFTDATKCRRALLAELTKRYGDRPVVKVDGSLEQSKWNTRDEEIVLLVWQLSDSDHSEVVYSSHAGFARLRKPNKL